MKGMLNMKTAQLKKICLTLSKYVKFDAIRPITDLVALVTKDNKLYLGHTDRDNATIIANIDCDVEIPYTVINLTNLIRVLKATTVEDVSFKRYNDYLQFKGNGTYKLHIQLDENGNEFKLPITIPKSIGEEFIMNPLSLVCARNSKFLDTENLPKEYGNYYCDGTYTVTTDSIVVAATKFNTHIKEMNPRMVTSMSVFEEPITVAECENGYRMKCDCYNAVYYTEKTNSYPVDTIMPFVANTDDYTSKITFNRKDFIKSISRQDIFKSVVGEQTLLLTFADGCVRIENEQETFYEELSCDGNGNEIKLKVFTNSLLKILRLMEDDLTLFISTNKLRLQDSEGLYILAGEEF